MIDWTEEAVEAALKEWWQGHHHKKDTSNADDMRAALDAAVKAQGMTTGDRMSGVGYCRGYNDALEEAAKVVVSDYGRDGVKIAQAIRALKGETP